MSSPVHGRLHHFLQGFLGIERSDEDQGDESADVQRSRRLRLQRRWAVADVVSIVVPASVEGKAAVKSDPGRRIPWSGKSRVCSDDSFSKDRIYLDNSTPGLMSKMEC